MRSINKYLALTTAIILLSIVGVSAQNTAKPARTIEQQAYKKVLGLTRYGVFDFITVQVQGNTVILEGKVNSIGTLSEAGRAMKEIAGVERVVNNIQQLPPSPMDDAIRREALREFARGGLSGYLWETRPDMHIIVEYGRITLEGYVTNSGDRDRANIYANGISGVFQVTNNLIVGKDAMR
ncbi:hypothetical protein BH10ACI3_BH10ACI3_21980 [soil metagenome]